MISVIMSSYKEDPAVVQKAVSSILDQRCTEHLELIFVIDDPTNAPLRLWAAKALTGRDDVALIENESNIGLACSLNRALKSARGEFICRMDCDDEALPGRLQNQLDYLKRAQLDLVGGRMEVIDEEGHALYTTPRLPSRPEQMRKASRWNNSMPHPTWFGTSDIFRQIEYRAIPLCEDYDFQLRAILAGFKLGNVDDVVLRYCMTEGSLSRTGLYRQYLYQRYLTEQYAHGRLADIASATEYVTKRYKAENEEAYGKANGLFNRAMRNIGNGHTLRGLFSAARIPFTSLPYTNKLARMLRAALIASR